MAHGAADGNDNKKRDLGILPCAIFLIIQRANNKNRGEKKRQKPFKKLSRHYTRIITAPFGMCQLVAAQTLHFTRPSCCLPACLPAYTWAWFSFVSRLTKKTLVAHFENGNKKRKEKREVIIAFLPTK